VEVKTCPFDGTIKEINPEKGTCTVCKTAEFTVNGKKQYKELCWKDPLKIDI